MTFLVNASDINVRYNATSKSEAWFLRNALREMNQKRIKNDKNIKSIKRQHKLNKNAWSCPICKKHVHRLTSAHCGTRVTTIIDNIINSHKKNQNIIFLDAKVQEAHKNIMIAVCCDSCNKNMETYSHRLTRSKTRST